MPGQLATEDRCVLTHRSFDERMTDTGSYRFATIVLNFLGNYATCSQIVENRRALPASQNLPGDHRNEKISRHHFPFIVNHNGPISIAIKRHSECTIPGQNHFCKVIEGSMLERVGGSLRQPDIGDAA